MELRTLCCGLPSQPLQFSNHRIISSQTVGTRTPLRFQFANTSKCLKLVDKGHSLLRLSKFRRHVTRVFDSNVFGGFELIPKQISRVPVTSYDDGEEPFHGKSGCGSFYGMTYQSVEEGELEKTTFEKQDSYLWLLAPAAFISCLILSHFFVGSLAQVFLKDLVLVDIVSSFSSEVLFYIGLATFLYVADRVQRPYLHYSPKRWGLITGLRGYLYSAIFTMGLKVIAPVLLLYISWSVVRLEAIVAIVPFLVGCAAQLAFERTLNRHGSSCWPIVPIIFEVYRMYQVSKAANFAERLLYAMRDLPETPAAAQRSGALFAIMVTFQLLGMLCLWSFMTFLVRLFPSRPKQALITLGLRCSFAMFL